uniref:Uncharacterized protein n=1 Tax=Paenibacillus athensensis TaxID=1967502 RepID=A0A4Y8Q0E6_9BACL
MIGTADQLNQLRKYPTAYFVLNADIDLGASSYATGWTPISSFRGALNGQGHTISGLKIVGAGTNVGMFGMTSAAASIGNLVIKK